MELHYATAFATQALRRKHGFGLGTVQVSGSAANSAPRLRRSIALHPTLMRSFGLSYSHVRSHAKNATTAWNMPILSTRILG